MNTRSAMYPRNLFRYSTYWGNWSRVLRFMQPRADSWVDQVELNLTAINPTIEREWEHIPQMWVRCHSTMRHDRDVYVADLPQHALELMRQYLDEPTIERLLHEDILSQIDFDKYRSVCNGGAPLRLIRKEAT